MKWYKSDLNNIAEQSLIIDEETGKTIAVVYDKINAPLLANAPKLLETLRIIKDAFWSEGEPLQERIDDLKMIAERAINDVKEVK